VLAAVIVAQKAWAQVPREEAMTPKRTAEPGWSIRTLRKKLPGSMAASFQVAKYDLKKPSFARSAKGAGISPGCGPGPPKGGGP
jgi:hypothetical protein